MAIPYSVLILPTNIFINESFTFTETVIGVVLNTATLTWYNRPSGQPIMSTADSSVTINIGEPVPTVEKVAESNVVKPGDVVIWNITYENEGQSTGLDSYLLESIPYPWLTYFPLVGYNWLPPPNARSATSYAYELGNLAPNATGVVKFAYKITVQSQKISLKLVIQRICL